MVKCPSRLADGFERPEVPAMPKRLWRILKIGLLCVAVVVLLAVAIVGFGLYRNLQPQDVTSARAKWPKAMTFETADRAALDLVAKMTLEEKIAQMTGSGIESLYLSRLVRGTVGLVYAAGNERLGIPPIAFTDGPRGVIVGRSTSFPVAIARAATWDLDLQRRVGDAIGKEARAQGANYWGGLCLNIVRHPSMGRAQEVYGEDPWLTGEMGVAILGAVQRHSVRRQALRHRRRRAALQEQRGIDGAPCTKLHRSSVAVEHDVASFMSAYNKVRGEWCGENRHLLTEILRDEWGFRGFVTSDWMDGVYDGKRGVHAGLDVEMPEAEFYGDNLRKLVESGQVPQARSTRACGGSCARSSST
jgi:beta-glucosidase